MKIKPYTWPPHVILSPSLLPVSPGDARFAVMALGLSRSRAWPSRSVAACSAVGDAAKSTTPPSRARHLPHSRLHPSAPLLLLPWSPWTESEQAHCLQPIPRASSHGIQIPRNRSSSMSLASSSTSPSRAPSTRAPGILGFAAVGHQ